VNEVTLYFCEWDFLLCPCLPCCLL